MNLTKSIKELATQAGFSMIGVTTPDTLPHADVFERWLAQGRHGEMAYLGSSRSRVCRAHPRRILPECRSVIVLGIPYSAPFPMLQNGSTDSSPRGRIAAYAWGQDYHNILSRNLRDLVSFIEKQVGHSIVHRWYTDTGPLLERELAQRAGLGWIGKNTCLINPHTGSYFFLAEILLEVPLEPDLPFLEDRCGTCQRCISACPTGCILPDRTLDARQCISYLTIELKASIPVELRKRLDGWVFGCDICQQVCPWNRFTPPRGDPAFDSATTRPDPDLLEEIELTSDNFNDKYRHSPLRRAKRKGYLRNIAVALGNSSHPAAIESLTRALLSDPAPLVRAHSAWAIGQFNGIEIKETLEWAARLENDPMVKKEIQAALDVR